MDDGKIVGMLAHMIEPIGDPKAALSALSPYAFTFEKRGFGLAHGSDGRLETRRELFSCKFVEERFSVERVQMAWPALHEEEDDAFCLRGSVRDPHCGLWKRGLFGEGFVACHCGKSNGTEAAPSTA